MTKMRAGWAGFALFYVGLGLILYALGVHLSDGVSFAVGVPVGLLGAVGARAAWEQGLFGQRKEG